MSKSKTAVIDVKDLFEELKDENNRLLKQLLFAEKCLQLFEKYRNNLNEFYINCKCDENIKNRIIFNQLENEFKCISDEFQENQENIPNIDIKCESDGSCYSPNNQFNDQSNDGLMDQIMSSTEDNFVCDSTKSHFKSGCDSSYSKTKLLNKKLEISYYVCNYINCQFKCTLKAKIERHVNQFHLNKMSINCIECGEKFWNYKQLANHIKQTHNHLFDRRTQLFKCSFGECNRSFDKLSKLLMHRNRHFGEKSFKCDYPSCDWSFFTGGELRNHQVGYHKMALKNPSNEEIIDRNNTIEDRIKFGLIKAHIKPGFDSSYSITKHKNTQKLSHYICNYINCDFKCTVIEKIESHINKFHVNKTLIACTECEQQFWTHKQIANHIRETHHNIYDVLNRMFKCTYGECNLSFDKYSKLLLHRNRHFGEKSFKCEYPSCKWSFFTLGELKNHRLWSHSSEMPFVCDWEGCKQRFKLRNLLELHKTTHTGQQPYKCDWPGCELKFLKITALKVHHSSHIGLKTFRCEWPDCGHMFRSNGHLKTHYMSHTNERPFACEWPGCESRFISSSHLTRHKTVHNPVGDIVCDWPHCEKRFKAKSSLKLHIMSHKGEKPFKCEGIGCDMRFVDRKHMKKHFNRRHVPKH